MTVDTRPEVPLRVITQADVRASINRARKSLERAAKEIVWQVEMEAWRTLGYSSWTAMREAEYGGAAFMVPAKNRPELVARMRVKGLTQQEIAATAGVTPPTVREDLKKVNGDISIEPPVITNARGQQRPTTYTRSEPDVIDAEVVHVNAITGEVLDPLQEATDSTPVESATTTTCPTCLGTGKVPR